MGNTPSREDQLEGTEGAELPVATQPQTAGSPVEGEAALVQQQVAEVATATPDQKRLPEDRLTALLNAQGLEYLKFGKVTEFNMLREQYPDWVPRFPEISLVRLDLSRIDLRGAMLPFADLSQTTLLGARFNRACLMRAKFNGATITGSIFDEADLMGAEFRETRFVEQSGFFGTDFNGAKFEGAQGLTAEMLCRTSFHSAEGLDPKLVDEALALIKTSIRTSND